MLSTIQRVRYWCLTLDPKVHTKCRDITLLFNFCSGENLQFTNYSQIRIQWWTENSTILLTLLKTYTWPRHPECWPLLLGEKKKRSPNCHCRLAMLHCPDKSGWCNQSNLSYLVGKNAELGKLSSSQAPNHFPSVQQNVSAGNARNKII